MRKKIFVCLWFLGIMLAVQGRNIIPQPNCLLWADGEFVFDDQTGLYTNLKGRDRKFIRSYVVATLPVGRLKAKAVETQNVVQLVLADSSADMGTEGYRLMVTPQLITVRASSATGLFYGLQTLRQLCDGKRIRSVSVTDSPRFPYRGVMLDCSRHFWSKDFILKQIDALAYFKLNRLHLHLTDAGGWRMEIKKYPKLISESAYRTQSDWQKWWNENDRRYCHKGDSGAYGGFYTQKELREIVRYAAQRRITVIPEIEMPGHSNEVNHAYPALSCTGEPLSDLCVGNEETFRFLENVLTEVMRIFPSEYIHIGGDEAAREAWATCPRCRQRMRDEHLVTTAELQSYLTARIERFLNAHGRKLLGWDEILEGKIAPRAAVMSWRDEQGGIDASDAGHHVIMSPGGYCYLDKAQDAPGTQPKSFGGYLPLEKVYSYEPVPEKFKGTNIEHFVDGVQGNLWTEYVDTEAHVEYMLYPRLLAIAERGWTWQPAPYDDFRRRALAAVAWMQHNGYHPFDLSKEIGRRPESRQAIVHLARGKTVFYKAPYAEKYKAAGDSALTDGQRGNWDFGDGVWQGFIGAGGLDAVIDMGTPTSVHCISVEFLQSVGPDIFAPADVAISVSDDGKNFTSIYHKHTDRDTRREFFVADHRWTGDITARYIRCQAQADKQGGWIFTDEIVVK